MIVGQKYLAICYVLKRQYGGSVRYRKQKGCYRTGSWTLTAGVRLCIYCRASAISRSHCTACCVLYKLLLGWTICIASTGSEPADLTLHPFCFEGDCLCTLGQLASVRLDFHSGTWFSTRSLSVPHSKCSVTIYAESVGFALTSLSVGPGLSCPYPI